MTDSQYEHLMSNTDVISVHRFKKANQKQLSNYIISWYFVVTEMLCVCLRRATTKSDTPL